MSSTQELGEGFKHTGKRRRVDDDGAPEDENHALRKSLEEEHEAFKKKTKALAEKLDRVDECMESFKKTFIPSFGTVVGGLAEYRSLENAFEQAKAEIASLQLAPAQTATEETWQQNVIEMVEKHKYRITIPIITHAQVMEQFQPLIASRNKKHVDHLLDFVFLAKVGKWYCFQEVCDKGTLGLTEVRIGPECPLHGVGCKQVLMARMEATPHFQVIFKRFDPLGLPQ
ncbi:hypothetical protein FPRO05_07179 [Fusarium proliferatum]|uniref:Uncharacterized protein n=1 Tax=Gibberella intermedia TaxID=948311 RepID=A0A365MK64_GIBIN|nr:hypothetical protein FPRO05_07179 [Fusarium proliferatum]